MSDFIEMFVLIWAAYAFLVLFGVVIVLGLRLPAKLHGTPSLALAGRRIAGSLFGLAAILTIVMIVSQWAFHHYIEGAPSVGEMMRKAYFEGLAIYLLLGLPFILIRTYLLHVSGRRRVSV